MSTTIDQQFVEYIVKAIVGNPDAVEIKRTIDEKGVLLELTVDQQDLGRVIGKRGIGAQSLRTLLRALGTKNDARYNLKIVDVGDGESRERPAKKEEQASISEPEAESEEPNVEEAPAVEPEEEEAEKVAAASDEEDDREESRASRTRKELADLDDLDI